MGRMFMLSEYPIVSLSSHIPTYSCNHNATHMSTVSRVLTSVYHVLYIDNLSHHKCGTQIIRIPEYVS